jgi:Kazal-type serine protease inhibitor domain
LCQIPHKSYFIPAASQTLGTDAFHGNPLLPASHKYRRCQNNRAAAPHRICITKKNTPHYSTAISSSPLFIFLAETRLQHIGACKRNQATNPCHQGSVYNPACASNGRTYASAQHVRCLKAANPALEVLHDGACTVQEVEKIVGLDDVCRMAMHRYEWNPICGADNVTYTNAYTFLCAAKKAPEDKSKTNISETQPKTRLTKLM